MNNEIKRIQTYIPSFDEQIQGGIPESFNLLIAGTPGTGKTIFGLQYLYMGAKNGENGVYVSFEQKPEMLRVQANQFGWDITEYEKKQKIILLRIPANRINIEILKEIEKSVIEINAKRLVIDSLAILMTTSLPYQMAEEQTEIDKVMTIKRMKINDNMNNLLSEQSIKRFIYTLLENLEDIGTTNVIITDSTQNNESMTRDGVSEYACDGVVQLSISDLGTDVSRMLQIKKMRQTKISLEPFAMLIDKDGISIKKLG